MTLDRDIRTLVYGWKIGQQNWRRSLRLVALMYMAELFCARIYLESVGKEEGREKQYANCCEQDRAFGTAGCL